MSSTPSAPSRSRPRTQRLISRAVHLLAAAALGAFVYAPAELVEPARLVLQVLVVPTATITGLFLWQQARWQRWTRRRGRSAPPAAA